ncbi:HET-domain-containing protein [Pyrenochaeta sp. DS3sAY3a]|nr:HET-domain-containing protein [Pyrenochaeta sp. DS3sAY3a]
MSDHDYASTPDTEFRPTEVVRRWLDTCERVHAGHCGQGLPFTVGPWSRPLLLIDVSTNSLVEAPPEVRYIALSYTWGQDQSTASATLKNIVNLQEPNGLGAITLPRVIADSMKFVAELGERYLWVDRLCVVQDGPAKQHQLNGMGNIYAGSYFTLVAARNDDASGPLYATRNTPWPRKLRRPPSLIKHDAPKARPILSGKRIIVTQAQYLMRTSWYTRGWTLQEYLFSKRRVVFQGETVNWECLYDAWHEVQDVSEAKLDTFHGDSQITGLRTPPWPDMLRFSRLVAMYIKRDLTFPEDVLDAFAGILSHLSRTFQGGFISGLPQMCFDAALLWQPWKRHLRRRKSVKCADIEAVMPSWSWAGWTGAALHSESWRSASAYQHESFEDPGWQQCSWRTFSTLLWHYSVTLDSPRKPIKVTCHPISESDPLPASWSRSNGIYRHERYPHQLFQYPPPIRDPHIAHTPPISARFLHCTTKRVFLAAGETFAGSASRCPVMDLLVPETGAWAGIIQSHQFAKDETTTPCPQIELIEISRGSVENKEVEQRSFDEWERGLWPREGDIYHFYNVLWIEWKSNIAYRIGCGRVERSTWDSIEGATIIVTLG